MKNDWNINIVFLPFTATFGEVLFGDPISSGGFGIVVLELTNKSKNCLLHKMFSPKNSKCVARKTQTVI